jgi:hypothetical protein
MIKYITLMRKKQNWVFSLQVQYYPMKNKMQVLKDISTNKIKKK